METKICRICNIEKPINEYNKVKKIYYRTECKLCQSIMTKKWREKNKEKIYNYSKKYREEHKELYKELDRKSYLKNKEKIKKRHKEYREKNKEKIAKIQKEYYEKYKEKIKKKNNHYTTERRKNDDLYRLKSNIRGMIYTSFYRKKFYKKERTEKILGCSMEFFISYLLNTYKNIYGIEWDGKEKVHIDHIIPLKTANNRNEVIKLCKYDNLQLLKQKDNLKKSGNLNFDIKGE